MTEPARCDDCKEPTVRLMIWPARYPAPNEKNAYLVCKKCFGVRAEAEGLRPVRLRRAGCAWTTRWTRDPPEAAVAEFAEEVAELHGCGMTLEIEVDGLDPRIFRVEVVQRVFYKSTILY